MTRDEIKKQMRLELEQEIPESHRTTAIIMTHDGVDYTPEQLMQQIENDTEFGNQLLDSWIGLRETGDVDALDDILDQLDDRYRQTEEVAMDQQTMDRVIALMQKDIDQASKVAPIWVNTPSVPDDDGKLLTPKEAFQQVKDGTPFGKIFAGEFLFNYTIQEQQSKMLGIPIPDFDKEVIPIPVPNKQLN